MGTRRGGFALTLGVALLTALLLFPLYWMLVTAVLPTSQVLAREPALVPSLADMSLRAFRTAFERRPLGEGDLPLAELLEALPRDIPLGLEIPNLAAAEAGVRPFDHLKPSVNAANALLARLGA